METTATTTTATTDDDHAAVSALLPSNARRPSCVLWVQRRRFLQLSIEVIDAEDMDLDGYACTPICHMMSQDGLLLSVIFAIHPDEDHKSSKPPLPLPMGGICLPLFDAVRYGVVEGPRVTHDGRCISFGFVKRRGDEWPRLTSSLDGPWKGDTAVEYDWDADETYETDSEFDGSASESETDEAMEFQCSDCIQAREGSSGSHLECTHSKTTKTRADAAAGSKVQKTSWMQHTTIIAVVVVVTIAVLTPLLVFTFIDRS